ncbi:MULTISPECIES: hypothetical protein [Glutamicibacter]|uniref:hypothetical protein n=1 Tax=Glutamicibacter TaxID=1742989 RepID=UPI003FD210D6
MKNELAKLNISKSLSYLKNVGKSASKTIPSVFLLVVLLMFAPVFIYRLTHEEQLFTVFAVVGFAILGRIFLIFKRSMRGYEVREWSPNRAGLAILTRFDDLREQRIHLVQRFNDETFAEYVLATSEPEWTTEQLMEHALEKHPLWRKSIEHPAKIDVAHHEAGHALVAYLNGSTVLKVTVRPSGNLVGHCEYANDSYPRPSEEVSWAMLQTSLAGQAVDHARGIRDSGSASDMQSCISHAYNLISIGEKPEGYEGDLTTDALISSARELTKETVNKHISTISEFAELLSERGTLNGREARLFFRSRLGR